MHTGRALVTLVTVLALAACGGAVNPLVEEPAPKTDGGPAPTLPDETGLRPADDGGKSEVDVGVGGGGERPVDAGVVAVDASISPVVPPSAGAAVGSACLRAPALPPVPQAHVIGVYESTGGVHGYGQAHVPGPIQVKVTAAASPATLFLMSYEPITWQIALESGASVAKVFVSTYYPSQTTVTGLPASVPVTGLTAGAVAAAYGWEATYNQGGGSFDKAINVVRSKIGGLEATYQGAYGGSTFTVPPPAGAIHSHYDNRVACTDACGMPSGTMAWKVISPGTTASTSGLVANVATSTWGASLRGSRGARCGKHYFEIDAQGAGKVTATVTIQGLGFYPLSFNQPTADVKGGRLGVAIDLDAATIAFVTASGAGSAQALPLWDHEEIVPAVDVESTKSATVTLVTRAPFAFSPPAGFAGDL